MSFHLDLFSFQMSSLFETSSLEAKIQIALPDVVEGIEPVEPVMVSSAVWGTRTDELNKNKNKEPKTNVKFRTSGKYSFQDFSRNAAMPKIHKDVS